jgi:hypothetical protein
MSSPSSLGDLGRQISYVRAYTTSTARLYVRTSDTGTVATTGTAIDLSRAVHLSSTGGKPLDSTVHSRKAGPPVWRSVNVTIPLELVFHSSGRNTYVTVAHKHRSATAGAGSTWATLQTDVFRFKMGTDTDMTIHTGVKSSCNLQAVKRYYKANITFSWKKASSTSVADTSTEQEMVCNSAVYEFNGAEFPEVTVPYKVS